MSLPLFPSAWMSEEHTMLQDSVRRFFTDKWVPHAGTWREAGIMPRACWNEAGAQGLLCLSSPSAYGGGGGDFGHEAVVILEASRANLSGWGGGLHSAIVAPYLFHCGTEEQKQRFLPRMATGELATAIAMTEPGTGSDLQAVRTTARRDGDEYVINGAKTFITNGQHANLIIVVCKTDPTQGARGTSLLVVETDNAPGFERGRNLDKLGMEAADTSELFFNDVRVPVANLLGEGEGHGFFQLMGQLPQERLNIAIQGIATIERALELTIDYVKQRGAFGKKVIDFQNTQFVLAECKTEATIARVFVDHCIEQHLKGKLDASTASMAKYWVTDLENKIIDRCLQLYGGFGYMSEYPIARMYRDSRVQRIYGGTNEIMKVLIARTL